MGLGRLDGRWAGALGYATGVLLDGDCKERELM
jgi:hypothetical protein